MNWRIQRLLSWLAEPKALYFSTIPVLLGFLAIRIFDSSEPSIRITGLVLQIMGISTVIWGISKTRRHFGHPSAIDLILAWLRRFPLKSRIAYMQPDGITMGASLVGGRLTSVVVTNPQAPLDERLKIIEQALEILQDRIESTENQLDQNQSKTDGRILVETRTRQSEDEKIMAAIESTSTGGLYVSAIGALWLFVGVILSTAAIELSRFIA